MCGRYDEIPLEIGEQYTATVKEVYDDWAVSIVDGAAIALQSGEVEPGQRVDVEVTGWARQSATGELLNKHSPPDSVQEQTHQTTGSSVKKEDTVQTTPDGTIRSENEKEDSKSDLDQLKQEAEEDSQEEVTSTTRKTTTTEYSRSDAVKRYVKARANGVCEGCDTPAPFENAAGEPYLHAHHIHELSEGGPDTLETVIALCPNCHYRVHHGKDGEEYNQELKQNLAEIEEIPIETLQSPSSS